MIRTGRVYRLKVGFLGPPRWKECWMVLATDGEITWFNDLHCHKAVRPKFNLLTAASQLIIGPDAKKDAGAPSKLETPLSISSDCYFGFPSKAGGSKKVQLFCIKDQAELLGWIKAFSRCLGREKQFERFRERLREEANESRAPQEADQPTSSRATESQLAIEDALNSRLRIQADCAKLWLLILSVKPEEKRAKPEFERADTCESIEEPSGLSRISESSKELIESALTPSVVVYESELDRSPEHAKPSGGVQSITVDVDVHSIDEVEVVDDRPEKQIEDKKMSAGGHSLLLEVAAPRKARADTAMMVRNEIQMLAAGLSSGEEDDVKQHVEVKKKREHEHKEQRPHGEVQLERHSAGGQVHNEIKITVTTMRNDEAVIQNDANAIEQKITLITDQASVDIETDSTNDQPAQVDASKVVLTKSSDSMENVASDMQMEDSTVCHDDNDSMNSPLGEAFQSKDEQEIPVVLITMSSEDDNHSMDGNGSDAGADHVAEESCNDENSADESRADYASREADSPDRVPDAEQAEPVETIDKPEIHAGMAPAEGAQEMEFYVGSLEMAELPSDSVCVSKEEFAAPQDEQEVHKPVENEEKPDIHADIASELVSEPQDQGSLEMADDVCVPAENAATQDEQESPENGLIKVEQREWKNPRIRARDSIKEILAMLVGQASVHMELTRSPCISEVQLTTYSMEMEQVGITIPESTTAEPIALAQDSRGTNEIAPVQETAETINQPTDGVAGEEAQFELSTMLTQPVMHEHRTVVLQSVVKHAPLMAQQAHIQSENGAIHTMGSQNMDQGLSTVQIVVESDFHSPDTDKSFEIHYVTTSTPNPVGHQMSSSSTDVDDRSDSFFAPVKHVRFEDSPDFSPDSTFGRENNHSDRFTFPNGEVQEAKQELRITGLTTVDVVPKYTENGLDGESIPYKSTEHCDDQFSRRFQM